MLQRTEQQNPQPNNQPTSEGFFQLLSISGSFMPHKVSIFYFSYFLLSNYLNLIIAQYYFDLGFWKYRWWKYISSPLLLFQEFISLLQLIIEMITGFNILRCKGNF